MGPLLLFLLDVEEVLGTMMQIFFFALLRTQVILMPSMLKFMEQCVPLSWQVNFIGRIYGWSVILLWLLMLLKIYPLFPGDCVIDGKSACISLDL